LSKNGTNGQSGHPAGIPDPTRVCLTAIARVTGHRAEDLTADMHLEADLGLDSIKKIELLGSLQQALPEERRERLSQSELLREVMSVSTVDDLVRVVAQIARIEPEVPVDAEEPAAPPASLVLADAQVPFLVASISGASLCALCSSARLRGRFDSRIASEAWSALIERHPILRARFLPAEALGDWRIEHVPSVKAPRLEPVSLAHLPRAEQDRVLVERRAAAVNRAWDLSRWPLHEFKAYALSADEHELQLENHHLVSDGLGNQMLLRHLLEIYAALAEGRAPRLEALSARAYNQTVTALDGWEDRGEDKALERFLGARGSRRAFWNLRGRKPTDGIVRSASRYDRLSQSTTAALVAQVGAMRVPLNALVTAAYLRALGDVAELGAEVVLHVPTGGRSHPGADASDVAGCFAQNLLLDFDAPRAGESWGELCRRVAAEVGQALGDGVDRAQIRRAALTAKKQRIPQNAPQSALRALVRASVRSNLYLPFIGNTRIERRYGPLEVMAYQAVTGTNPATVDSVIEIFDGALQFTCNYDAEFFSPQEIDALAQAFVLRLGELAAAVESTPRRALAGPAPADALQRVAAAVSEVCRRTLAPGEAQADLEADLGLDSLDRVRVVHRLRRDAPQVETQRLLTCRSVAELALALGGAPTTAPEADPLAGTAAMPYLRFMEQARRTPGAIAVQDTRTAITYRDLDERSDQVARSLGRQGVAARSLVGLLVRPSAEMLVGLLGILKAGCAYVPLDPEYPVARLAYVVEHAGIETLVSEQALALELLTAIDPRGRVRRVLLVAGEAACGDRAVIPASAWGGEPREPVPQAVGPDDLMTVLYTSGSTGKPKGVMLGHRGYMNRLVWMQKAFELRPGERVAQKTSPCFDISVWELLWPLMYGATVCPVERRLVRDPWQLAAWMRDSAINVMHFVPSLFTEFVASLDEGASFPALRWLVFSGEELPASAIRAWMDRCGERVGLANLYGPTEASIDVSWHVIDRKPAADERIPIGRPVDNTELVVLDEALRPCPDGAMGELWIGGVQLATGYLRQPELTAERFQRVPAARSPVLYRTGDLATRTPDSVFHFHGRTDSQVKVRGFRVELGEIEAVLHAIPGVRESAVLALDEGEGKLRLVAYLVCTDPALDARSIRAQVGEKLPDYMVPHRVEFRNGLPRNANGKLDRGALRATSSVNPAPAASPAPVQVAASANLDLVDLPRARELPAGPAQRWIFSYFPEPYAWFGYSRFRYTRPLDLGLLERALDATVDGHDALRTTFTRGDSGWRQVVHLPGRRLAITVYDLGDMSEEERELEVQRLLERSCAGMSIEAWPLIAVLVFQVGNGSHDVVVVGHHLVSDLLSNQLLFEEVWSSYERLAREPSATQTGPKAPSYADYASALERSRADGTLARHAAWYRAHLGQGAPLAVPFDCENGSNVESADRVTSLELQESLSRRLQESTRLVQGASVYHLLVAPLYAALAEWTGQRWVVLSHRSHGRDLGEGGLFYRSVGNFAVNHPLGVNVLPELRWAERVAQVRDTLSQAPMNGVAYDMVGSELGPSLYPDAELTPVRVNYLGNRTTPTRDGFEFIDAHRDQRFALPGQLRTTLIEVFLSFAAGRLHVDVSSSANHHQEGTMRALLDRYARQLQAMVDELEAGPGRRETSVPVSARIEAVSAERPLAGKVAIVTGGGRGIGREAALALARQGACVAVAARTREQVEACVRDLQSLSAAIPIVADVGRLEDAERMVAAAVARFGGLDILVNNAGVTSMMTLAESDPDEWRRVMDVNLFGAYHCCRAAIPQLRRRGGGAIVNVGSDSSHIGYPLLSAYAASKHAVLGLTRALAEEVKLDGIKVNAVCPAMVDTDMLPKAFRGEAIPPANVAQVIAFLASPASDGITGETIKVHGKQDMYWYGSRKMELVRAAIGGSRGARPGSPA
jgi:amino acid adenylation domain-containing protein